MKFKIDLIKSKDLWLLGIDFNKTLQVDTFDEAIVKGYGLIFSFIRYGLVFQFYRVKPYDQKQKASVQANPPTGQYYN